MGEVNLDRLRELAAEIRKALVQLNELAQTDEAALLIRMSISKRLVFI